MGEMISEISILVASNRRMMCEMYTQVLNRHSGLNVVGQAESAEQVINQIKAQRVDVLLLTPVLEDGPSTGLTVLQQIRKISAATKTVILIEESETHLVVPSFRAGARGVFSAAKDGIKQLCRCVKKVHDGQVWANSEQLGLVMEAFSQTTPLRIVDAKGTELLTKREEDVVRLVERGLTNKDIASELRLSEHTVRNNLFRIFDKLGVSSRVELALYALNSSKRMPIPMPAKVAQNGK